mgnify:CR=1 FL=1
MFSKFLISEDIITNRTTGQTETERTRILLDTVQNKILKIHKKLLIIFILMLAENPVYEDVAIWCMTSKNCKKTFNFFLLVYKI